jgi:hypothetical protein
MSILKKLIISKVKDAALRQASEKILPMEGVAPKKLGKGKLAAILAVAGAIAAAAPEFIK